MRKGFKSLMAITLVGAAMCMGLNTSATNISDLETEKEQAEQKRDEAQAVVDQLQNEQENIMASIEALDIKVNEFNAQISEIELQKIELQANITKLQDELVIAKAEETAAYEAMKQRIQYSYENGNISYIDTIFSTSDVSDIVNQSEYISQIYNYDSNMFNGLMEIRKNIANKELLLQLDMDSLEALEAEVNLNKEAVETMINGKKEQVDSYVSSIEDYQTKVSEYQADVDATNAAIEEAERQAELARQAEIERLRQQALEEARQQAIANGEDPDKVTVEDPVIVAPTFTTLQWPVSTGGVVTSVFGPRWGSFHNGLDIGCPIGTPIVAAEAGTVILSQYSGSAGNYIIIDHGNGTTTVYMHNSQLLVSVGQTVVRGQVIAYAGSTGWSTGPHCHIGLRINGKYVDPYPYLTQ